MSKSIVINQSNYLPWKGYFDNIALADEFVVYDCVQYTRQDWRNRNQIKTQHGLQWLTVPVKIDGLYDQLIEETRIEGNRWAIKHWRSIKQNYGKQPGFHLVEEFLGDLFANMSFEWLSELNLHLIESIMNVLNIDTRIRSTEEFSFDGDPTERLVQICQQAGATRYLSGPAAKAYLREELFAAAGIEVDYFDNHYDQEYVQPFPPFVHQVSVIDLIACCGERAGEFMKHTDQNSAVG
jgi:hypothetical protein